jgi:DNA modification methylase
MNWKDLFPKENRYFETENGILYCGDCLEIMKKFPENSIDLIITDPPYGVNSNEKNGIDYKDKFYDVKKVSKELFKILKDNSRAFVFTAQKTFIDAVFGFEDNGFKLHQTLIWFKPNLAGGTKKKTYDFTSVYEQILNFHKGKPNKIKKVEGFNNFDVLKYAQPQSNFKKDKRYHVHQKSLELIEHLILVSTDENDLVLDCFTGAGTTCVVAERLKRRWIGIEINKEYCEIAKKRILGEL